MIPHRDEILRPAVSTDATAVPRYNLVRPDGTIIEKNVAMRLSNPVAREGTPISKAVLDEMLAASGVTTGTATAYTLAQEEYTLFDGAPVRFRLHTASGDGATLNINGTGAKPLRDMMGEPMAGGVPAGTWLTAYYSAAAGAYVLAGGEAVRALYGEQYTVDDAVAHIKDVPADALPYAEIGEIGGMTYKINVGTEAAPVYELRSAEVTEAKSVGVNLFDIIGETDTHYDSTIISGDTLTVFIDGRYARGETYIIKVKPYTTYHILYDVSCGGNATGHIVSIKNATESVWVSYINSSPYFDTGNSDKIYVDFSCHGDGWAKYKNIMIAEGATALPYTPYFHDILPIPEAVRALDGYGWGYSATIRNYVDLKHRKFVKMVNKLILDGSNTVWNVYEGNALYNTGLMNDAKKQQSSGLYALCAEIPEHKTIEGRLDNDYIERVSQDVGIQINNVKNVWGLNECTSDAFNAYLANNPITLYYELAEPIITDISDILPADNFLHIEAGGTITAVNEYGYAVPTTITYQRDVLANRASIFALEKLRLAMELLASIDYVDDTVSAAIAAAVAPLAKANLSNVSGTFGGVVKANAAAVANLGTAQVRNVTISATDLTAGSSALATGDSYRVYS